MKQKKFKSFEELKNAMRNDEFEEFVRANLHERRRILSSYDLDYQGIYKGKYKKDTNKVVIADKENPFTGETLQVRFVGESLGIPDNASIIVRLIGFKDSEGPTPDNIFAGKFIEEVEKNRKRHDRNELSEYTKAKIEKELIANKEQAQASIRQARQEQEKAEQEAIEKKKKEDKIQQKQKRARWEEYRAINEEKTREQREQLQREKLRKMQLHEKRKEEVNRKQQKQIRIARGGIINKKKQARAISVLLQQRKISNLIHFTRIDNIDSILRNGLLPVSMLKTRNIKFVNNDDGRYDKQTDCTCLSVEYPNYWVLKDFRKRYPSAKWMIIVLDSSLLLNHECYFAEYNAASRGIKDDLLSRTTSQAFQNMFADVVKVALSYRPYYVGVRNCLKNEFSYLPTSDQAEILVEGIIDKKYIKEIWFMDKSDADKYRGRLENEGIFVDNNIAIFTKKREEYNGFRER